MFRRFILAMAAALTFAAWGAQAEQAFTENGMHTEPWFAHDSFLELADDLEVANSEGKRLIVVFEQKGCIYCQRMHEEVLSHPYIRDYVKDNFRVVQLDLWGPRTVVDFDGEEMAETDLARKWRANYTPGIFFFPTDIPADTDKSGGELYVHRMDGGFGRMTFTATFEWVLNNKVDEINLQRYLTERIPAIRDLLKKAEANS